MSTFSYYGYATFYDPDNDWQVEVMVTAKWPDKWYAWDGWQAAEHTLKQAGKWCEEHHPEWQLVGVRTEVSE